MRFIDSMRFAAWREIRGRWPLILGLPVCFGLGVLLPEPYDAAWSLFVLVLVAPAFLGVLAAGGPASADRFWAGMGGPAAASVLVRVALHLLPVLALAPAAFVLADILSEDALGFWLKFLVLCGLVTLYCTTLAARALTSGFPVLVGPLVGLGVLALGTWLNFRMRFLPFEWSLAGRMLALSLLCLYLASRWEGRTGVWGASLGRRWGRVLVPVLAFLGGCVGAEVGLRAPLLGQLHFVQASEDGRRVVLRSPWLLYDWDWQGRSWLWQDGHVAHLGEVGMVDLAFGPEGALLLSLSRGGDPPRFETVLITADGERTRCADMSEPVLWADVHWAEDGLSVTFENQETYLEIRAGQGCRAVPRPVEVQEARHGGHVYRVSSDAPGVLTLDGLPIATLTYRSFAHGHDRGERVGAVELVEGEDGVLAAVGSGHTFRGARLYRVVEDRAEILDEVKGRSNYVPFQGAWSHEWVGNAGEGHVCRTDGDLWRCWDTAGVVHEEPEPPWGEPEPCLKYRETECILTQGEFRLSDGGRIPVEAGASEHVVLDPDHLRIFYDSHFTDLGPEGVSTTHF